MSKPCRRRSPQCDRRRAQSPVAGPQARDRRVTRRHSRLLRQHRRRTTTPTLGADRRTQRSCASTLTSLLRLTRSRRASAASYAKWRLATTNYTRTLRDESKFSSHWVVELPQLSSPATALERTLAAMRGPGGWRRPIRPRPAKGSANMCLGPDMDTKRINMELGKKRAPPHQHVWVRELGAPEIRRLSQRRQLQSRKSARHAGLLSA